MKCVKESVTRSITGSSSSHILLLDFGHNIKDNNDHHDVAICLLVGLQALMEFLNNSYRAFGGQPLFRVGRNTAIVFNLTQRIGQFFTPLSSKS